MWDVGEESTYLLISLQRNVIYKEEISFDENVTIKYDLL